MYTIPTTAKMMMMMMMMMMDRVDTGTEKAGDRHHRRLQAVADSKGGWPPCWLTFFKPFFFRVKGIYFVVHICDK